MLNKQEFGRRFCDFRSHESEIILFSDTFHYNPESALTKIQLELIELQESSGLKSSFRDVDLDRFFSSIPSSTYPSLHKHAFEMASRFGSTFACEKNFLVMSCNKSKL